MEFKSREEVNRIKRMYPTGTIIELIHMDDPQAPSPGTKGTVYSVDDRGQIHCKEFGLAVIPGEDRFKVITRG